MITDRKDIKPGAYYAPGEIATLLKVHHSTVIRKIHDKQLRAINIGSIKKATWRVSGEDLMKYLNNTK